MFLGNDFRRDSGRDPAGTPLAVLGCPFNSGTIAGGTPSNQDANIHGLSFEERLGLLVDRQWNWRQNRALERRLRNGRLQGPACVEDIDYRTPRGLDRQLVRSLAAESAWVREHQHLFLIGPTGIGKTWLGRALAQKACRTATRRFS
jgi:DNA replication protein DnaC